MTGGLHEFQRTHTAYVSHIGLALMATGVLAAPITYRLHVDGLSCPFCAYGLEKKLGEVEGVQSLETNIKDGTVTVTMNLNGTALKNDYVFTTCFRINY